ncbi:hypothetical protein MNV49_000081 [Pseudohyphozyma bogoriensis]|nr:hypothetical protein MNV49_000081 [Pseudohyphozyma bogoriensis]
MRPATRLASQLRAKIDVLKSPQRTCFLTNRVLPRAFLVPFKLAKTASKHNSVILLTPELLHSRWTERKSGKAMYVMCREEAVDMLQKKGSYKRLNASAVMPSYSTSVIKSQLARRIVQEATLLAERAKARPKPYDCPFRPLEKGEWENRGWEKDARKVVAVVKLSSSSTPTSKREEGRLFSEVSEGTVLMYDLGTYFEGVLVPPRKGAEGGEPEKGGALVEELRRALDECLELFARRKKREELGARMGLGVNDMKGLKVDVGKVGSEEGFVIYGDDESDGAVDTVPIQLALWRLRLWTVTNQRENHRTRMLSYYFVPPCLSVHLIGEIAKPRHSAAASYLGPRAGLRRIV